jgi:hypothetical protein
VGSQSIKLSLHGLGSICFAAHKGRDELLPFVGRTYSKAEFKTMKALSLQFIRYVLKAETDVYEDRDVKHGNVASFINSSIGHSHISNIFWEYSALSRPWNTKEWGYTKTIAQRDISAGEELFTYYPVNL